MKIFTSILDTRIETIRHTKYEITVSTDLNIYNTVKLMNDLNAKDIYACSMFKLYRRWTFVFDKETFDKAVENGIIQ